MKYAFYFFAFLYAIAPLIFVPYWAYHNNNGILLFGIIASYLGTAATWKFKTSAASAVLILIIVAWLRGGFHLSNPYFFFLMSAFWGSVNFLFAGSYLEEIAKNKSVDRINSAT